MRTVLRSVLSVGVCLAIVGLSDAMVRRVPAEYATIQSALNAVEDWDTVLVEIGVYQEALIAPMRSNFVIRGNVIPDTGDYPRPVIDPSHVPRPDTVACLLTQAGSSGITIEDMAFRNGIEMYDTIPRRIAGIGDHSENLTLRRCLFDSTYGGVSAGVNLYLEDCHFDLNRTICARTDSGRIHAENCIFSCHGGGGQNVSARGHSTFRNCRFRDNRSGHLLVTLGDSILVEDCVFGPYGPQIFSTVIFQTGIGSVIRRNIFENCGIGHTVLQISVNCTVDDPLPIVISQNIFRNYYGGEGYGGSAIMFQCFPGSSQLFMGEIEDNVFEDGSASPLVGYATGVEGTGNMSISRNRFTRLEPPNVPDVHGYRVNSGPPDTLVLRDNLLDAEGVAATVDLNRIDARWNWWGDSSGPYNIARNPDGQGGEVGSGVLFEPWYTDTTFDTDEQRPPIVPDAFSLSAYPNPFNSKVEFRLTVPHAGAYDITLFDVLGRRAASVWHGRTEREQRVSFDASTLSSGIYFAHLRGHDSESGATTKILLLK